MLNYELGSCVNIKEREHIVTRSDAVGHALFGPYHRVEPGSYRVDFLIDVVEASAIRQDKICALLDVVSDFGGTEIAYDFVTSSQLSSNRTIGLRFDLPVARELEFRVYLRGDGPLSIADEPTLTKLTETEALACPVLPITLGKSAIRSLFHRGADLALHQNSVTLTADRESLSQLVRFGGDRDQTARHIIEAIGYRGPGRNSLYRAFVGTDHPAISPPHPVSFTSSLCQQAHFLYDQYRFWSRAIKEAPQFSRKQWEFVFIAQVLFERGYLTAGNRGLVFGAGQEPLPALFASYGVEILASDQAADDAEQSGWTATGQHTFDLAALNQRSICTDFMFNKLVSFMPVDMNAIPENLDEKFDFCWSACALEHLGSIEHGLAFIENSMQTLRPGGIAVHTTEFNLTSNDDTLESQYCVFFRRRDIDALVARLENKGYEVAPIDWRLGEGFAERVVDLPPYGGGEPHIRLRADNYDVTSIGLIVRK